MLYPFEDKEPVIAKNIFIADTACIIGDGSINEGSSVWFNTVIRADKAKISIGKSCSIMHGHIIEKNVLIGMNATILPGAEIGEYSIIGAGALIPPDHNIPARSVVKNYEKLAKKYLESTKIR